MDNYEFCVDFALSNKQGDTYNVLDYGCGAGRIVSMLRDRDINAYGCDITIDSSTLTDPSLEDVFIKQLDNLHIPFGPKTFDLVINNQVMEHVEDMEKALCEIHKVLKPNGLVLSLFPDKSIWREGHCGLPFMHWFPDKSRLRFYYAFCMRALGLGYNKHNKSIHEWCTIWCEYMDNWTWYRTYKDIMSLYKRYFCDIKHIELFWLNKRLGDQHILNRRLPCFIKQFLIRKYVGMIFVCRKKSL